MNARDDNRHGKIVTFYSYKGGTGRSMALANVAFLLANAGKRVLMIDWDLEAPGLHRYFEPFLSDKTLEHSTGVIDFVRDFATAALARGGKAAIESNWYQEYADLLAHAVPLAYEFEGGGALHLVPAGRQDTSYGVRVNSFDWESFYMRLGGGILLEAVKENLRRVYDFILVDSRTGVSDTSGICTIQMPDELVVCFTLNRQSIYGASAAARLTFDARHGPTGTPTLKIWPVPMRVEYAEKERMELAAALARVRFTGLMPHLDPEKEELYWGEIPVAYEPYYAYEEVLAPFRDRPRRRASLLTSMEVMAGYLNDGSLDGLAVVRGDGPEAFGSRSALDYEQEFGWLAEEYEHIRRKLSSSRTRTSLMAALFDRAQALAGQRGAGAMADKLFAQGTEGSRIVGLALAQREPQPQHLELALQGIAHSRSAFEQYNALILANALTSAIPLEGAVQLQEATAGQLGATIDESDPSRFRLAQTLTKKLGVTSSSASKTDPLPTGAGKAPPLQKRAIDRKNFFDGVRVKIFHGILNDTQVTSMSAILDEYEKRSLIDLRWLAYMFGTVHRECGSNMAPVRETFAASDAQARARLANASYAQPDPITHQSYYGRGLVQLTHKINYAKQGARLGIDLVNNPDLALDPHIAVDIMFTGMIEGQFTGVGLPKFLNDTTEDWVNARRIINALDHAEEVAAVSRTFFAALRAPPEASR